MRFIEKYKILVLIPLIYSLFASSYSQLSYADTWSGIRRIENGWIDWSKRIVQAKGSEAPSEKYQGAQVARIIAEKEALKQAYTNLLKITAVIPIDEKTYVADIIRKGENTKTEIEKIINKAEVTKKEYLSDGTAEVYVKLPINGNLSELLLPSDIRQIPSVKMVYPDIIKSSSEQDVKPYTGLVVDARGIAITPSLYVVIVAENSTEIYGAAHVSREFAVHSGMCLYMRDLAKAKIHKRVGANPFIVKGVKTQDIKSLNIVISNADAATLRGAPESISLLKQCKVIVVLD